MYPFLRNEYAIIVQSKNFREVSIANIVCINLNLHTLIAHPSDVVPIGFYHLMIDGGISFLPALLYDGTPLFRMSLVLTQVVCSLQ